MTSIGRSVNSFIAHYTGKLIDRQYIMFVVTRTGTCSYNIKVFVSEEKNIEMYLLPCLVHNN